MSELINNSSNRKELLKHMILKLHSGETPEIVRQQLIKLMKKIPYGEVVEVEQALISEGIPEGEIQKLCDLHTRALENIIELEGSKVAPAGHPAHTFLKENEELLKVIKILESEFEKSGNLNNIEEIAKYFNMLKGLFNQLMDVDKHYLRKENLLFPYLENKGITGPPKVMWGKHDETRELLKSAIETLNVEGEINTEEIAALIELILKPAISAVAGMTVKEEQILLPMCMDLLTDMEWYEIYRQTMDYGFCLYDPDIEWKPEGMTDADITVSAENEINMPTGSLSIEELTSILNTAPFDFTFVDKDDKVKYFSHGDERVFSRSRAILKRDVRMCHPPSSVHVVDQIIDDFKNGRQSRAPFWINFQGKFVLIEYFAVRDKSGNYLGTLEVTQDVTKIRNLEGEQRLLSYDKKD